MKGITSINVFQKILNESGCELNKIWIDKSSEFYNTWMRSWLDDFIGTYSTHNERKSAVAERFIRGS